MRPIHTERCSTNCQGQVLQFTPKTFVPALLHQLSRTGSPIHTEDFRSSAAPPTVKDRFSNSHRRLSLQRCSTNCQGQVLQFTPKTFPALLHQPSRTRSPIHTENFRLSPIHTEVFRSSAAPPTVKDRFSNSHRRLSLQRCSTNCQGQVLQFTPKTFAPALLHQLSRTGSPIHTEDFRSSAAPPTVKDRISNSHRRLSFQRCSTNCQGQDLQFTPKTFVPALLHQLSRTGSPSPIHTEDFRSSAAPPTVKDRISNSHRRLSFQRCSTNCQGQVLQFTPKTFAPALLVLTNCQGQVLQFTPKTFVPALLHQLSRTGSPIHTEDFRSSAAPPTVKDRFSNSHRRLSFQRCSTTVKDMFTPKTFVPALLHRLSRTGSPIHTEDFRSSAAPPTVKDRFSNSHRRLSLQRCSTNCQGQDLQFTPKTFVPALLHQLSRTGSPIHTEDFRSSAAPPTVKDRFQSQRLSAPTVKDRLSISHRRLSFQRCSTNCQGQVLQFTPKTFAPALLHLMSRTGSPIQTEDYRSSAAPPTVKDTVSNSHRKLSLQRCSLQFTPKFFVPVLLHQLSRTGSPIHTEDFGSSAAPSTVKDLFSNSHRRLSLQRCSTNCQGQVLQFTPKTFVPALLHQPSRTRFSNSHRKLSLQRCSNSHRSFSFQCCCQGQVLQFTPKTFVPALLHQLSRTGSPIHTEDFRSSAAPPIVKDRFSNSHRRLSLQRCATNCQGQVFQFAPKTFVPALLHQLSRTGSPIHTEDFRSSAAPPIVKEGSPIYTEDFRSSAAPPTVKDRFSNSHRRLSFQRCSTNCQGQVLQFTPKTFVPALLHQLSRTRFSTNCHGQVPKTFVPMLLHQLSRTNSPIHTENFRSNAAPPIVMDRFSTEDFRSNAAPRTVKDKFSNSHRRLSFQRCSTNCQGQDLQFAPKTFAPALLH